MTRHCLIEIEPKCLACVEIILLSYLIFMMIRLISSMNNFTVIYFLYNFLYSPIFFFF